MQDPLAQQARGAGSMAKFSLYMGGLLAYFSCLGACDTSFFGGTPSQPQDVAKEQPGMGGVAFACNVIKDESEFADPSRCDTVCQLSGQFIPPDVFCNSPGFDFGVDLCSYITNWACVPREIGGFDLEAAVKGPNFDMSALPADVVLAIVSACGTTAAYTLCRRTHYCGSAGCQAGTYNSLEECVADILANEGSSIGVITTPQEDCTTGAPFVCASDPSIPAVVTRPVEPRDMSNCAPERTFASITTFPDLGIDLNVYKYGASLAGYGHADAARSMLTVSLSRGDDHASVDVEVGGHVLGDVTDCETVAGGGSRCAFKLQMLFLFADSFAVGDQEVISARIVKTGDPVGEILGEELSLATGAVKTFAQFNVEGEGTFVGLLANSQRPVVGLWDPEANDFSITLNLRGTSAGGGHIAVDGSIAGTFLNRSPIASPGPNQVVECAGPNDTRATLDGTGSRDLDGPSLRYNWLLPAANLLQRGGEPIFATSAIAMSPPVGLGQHEFLLRVKDNWGWYDQETTSVTVVDTTRPVVSCSVDKPLGRFSKNHDLVDVGFTAGAADTCSGTLPVGVSVFADEDDEEPTGDGVFSPDAANIASGTLRLRDERRGNGDGRVYLMAVNATDGSGNGGVACCTATVPHSTKSAAIASLNAQAALAQAYCLATNGTAPSGYVVVGDGPIIGPKQ
jgi:hypothetical protein